MDCPRGDSANPTDPPDSGRIEIGPIGYIHSWKIRNSEDLATEKFSRDASYDILVKSDCISWPTTGKISKANGQSMSVSSFEANDYLAAIDAFD